jgi:hypothetical protein
LPRTPPAEALARAARTTRNFGWRIVAEVADDGRLEATASTLLFGFKDGVVVRIAPEESGQPVAPAAAAPASSASRVAP